MTGDLTLWVEVAQFLGYEARLLDEERYEDWLGLLTDDVRYWMPGIENRRRADPIGEYAPGRMAYFDDTLEDLRRRVNRFRQPSAWMEDPPTRHLHVVSNVEVEFEATDGEGTRRPMPAAATAFVATTKASCGWPSGSSSYVTTC